MGAKEGGEGGGRRRCGCEAIAAIVGLCGVDGVIDRCIGCIIDRSIGYIVDRSIGYIVDGCIGYNVDDGSIIVDGCADERIVRDSDWSITDTIAIDDGCVN